MNFLHEKNVNGSVELLFSVVLLVNSSFHVQFFKNFELPDELIHHNFQRQNMIYHSS